MKKLITAVFFLGILSLSELVCVFVAVGGLPTADDHRVAVATSNYMRNPNVQTQADLYMEVDRYGRREVMIERIFAVIAVLNTVALMWALGSVRKLRQYRMSEQSLHTS